MSTNYCKRFKRNSNIRETKNALIYSKLKEEGCLKKEAMDYSCKTFCNFDYNQKFYGPSSKRCLRLEKDDSVKSELNLDKV